MELKFKQRLFYFFPVLFAFCLPYGFLVLSLIVALWTIVSFFNVDREKFSAGIKNKHFLWMISFFVLTCLSAAFSSNKAEALTAVEIKLSCLIFPYLFFCFVWPVDIIKRMIVAFVSGCFFSCLILLARASFYALQGDTHYFFYNDFSRFIHPSYLAMYLVMALTCMTILYWEWFHREKKVLYLSSVFLIVFVLCIFLCSSKMGLISFFVALPLIVSRRFQFRFSLFRIVLLSLSILVLLLGMTKLFPGSFERLNSLSSLTISNIDKTSSESTAVRVLIWQQSLDIISDHWMFGAGVGDANDQLYKAYEENGLSGALQHHLNAHNQYLQTFIGMGLVGVLMLIILSLGGVVRAVLNKNFLLLMFAFLTSLNFLAESMLQTSAGILFFTFFYGIFTQFNEVELIRE